MERVKVLIEKLQAQVQQQADPAQLLLTVQMIQSEIQQVQLHQSKTLGTSKVAVVLPSFMNSYKNGEAIETIPARTEEEALKEKYAPKPEPTPAPAFSYDPLVEIPTLSHQKVSKDINEIIAGNGESLNDRLNEKKSELGDRLMDSPIRDLRKAIGINDRFEFIGELFRGDEAMYERSLKTINGFNIYPEAEYWISRELEIKLGWDNSTDTVQHFYQLVKRRFS